jgi:hypothetical protein
LIVLSILGKSLGARCFLFCHAQFYYDHATLLHAIYSLNSLPVHLQSFASSCLFFYKNWLCVLHSFQFQFQVHFTIITVLNNKMAMSLTTVLLFATAAIAAYSSSNHCSQGSSVIDDYTYCAAIERASFVNVGNTGSYQEITGMDRKSGTCTSQPFQYSGPLAPFDEGLSIHLRGPIDLRQFAVYVPSAVHHNKPPMEAPGIEKRHLHQHTKRATVSKTVTEYRTTWEEVTTIAPTATSSAHVAIVTTIKYETVTLTETDWVDCGGPCQPSMVSSALASSNISADSQNTHSPDSSVLMQSASTVTNKDPISSSTAFLETESTPKDNRFSTTHVLSATNVCPTGAGSSSSASTFLQSALVPTENSPNLASSTVSQSESALVDNHRNSTLSVILQTVSAATVNIPNTVSSAVLHSSPASQHQNGIWERAAYFNAQAQSADNVMFLNNMGGQGSGTWDPVFGSSLSYAAADAQSGSSSPVVFGGSLRTNTELAIFSGKPCDTDSCGYVREKAPGYRKYVPL